jgi:hypothetical protein
MEKAWLKLNRHAYAKEGFCAVGSLRKGIYGAIPPPICPMIGSHAVEAVGVWLTQYYVQYTCSISCKQTNLMVLLRTSLNVGWPKMTLHFFT